jgi:hypothetical protein
MAPNIPIPFELPGFAIDQVDDVNDRLTLVHPQIL